MAYGRGCWIAGCAIPGLLTWSLWCRAQAGGGLAPEAAHADEPPARDASSSTTQLEHPQFLSGPSIEYPTGAHGSATVSLEALIDRKGLVSEVRVLSGDPPFVEQAQRAVRQYRFTPATVEGRAAPARVRLRIDFHEPNPGEDQEDEVAGQGRKALASTAAGDGAEEVTWDPTEDKTEPAAKRVEVQVVGDKPPVEQTTLTMEEVRHLPGAFGDPFRALESQPGVTPILSGLPYFYVRGAPPGNVGYYVDGIRVPLLFHFALGPGVLQPDLLERVDIYPGVYPAEFGRYAGAIAAVQTRAPGSDRRVFASLKLTDAGGLVEAPVNRNTSVLLGGRYGFVKPVVHLFDPSIDLEYWDYQARLTHVFTTGDSLRLFAFGSHDLFGSSDTALGTDFHRVDLSLVHPLRGGGSVLLGSYFGQDQTYDDANFGKMRDRVLGTRLSIAGPLSARVSGAFGSDVVVDQYAVLQGMVTGGAGGGFLTDPSRYGSVLQERTDIAVGSFGQLTVSPEPAIRVRPGVRLDLYGSGSSTAYGVDPRILAEFDVARRLTLYNGVGVAHQPPAFAIPVPGYQVSGLQEGLQRSIQSSFGAGFALPAEVMSRATVFHNVFLNTTDPLGLSNVPEDYDLDQRTQGRGYGVELSLKRSLTHRLGGFLAYTLSRSVRAQGRFEGPTAYDRTHVANAAVSYRWRAGFRTGARAVFFSGRPPDTAVPPAPPSSSESPVPGLDPSDPTIAEAVDDFEKAIDGKRTTQRRTRPFWRLDFRAEKRWQLRRDQAFIALVLEVVNATLNREQFDLDCSPKGCRVESVGPITIPSLGVEAAL